MWPIHTDRDGSAFWGFYLRPECHQFKDLKKEPHLCKKNKRLFILTSSVYILHVKFKIKSKPLAGKSSSKIIWSGKVSEGF